MTAVGIGKKKPPPGSVGPRLQAEPGLEQLADRIRAVEEDGKPSAASSGAGVVPTGWGPFRGLVRGVVHEWFGIEGHTGQDRNWAPPLGLMAHLARQTLSVELSAEQSTGFVVWVGRRVWPHPRALEQIDAGLLERSIFVDPPDDAGRLWAIDLALRCTAFSVVVADGSRATMAHSRRLQLAAAGGGGLGLVIRPPWETKQLSAATTRWHVGADAGSGAGPGPGAAHRAARGPAAGPRWRVTLERCKGRQSQVDQGGRDVMRGWLMEQDRGQGVVRVHAEVVDRPGRAPVSEGASTDRHGCRSPRCAV